MGFLTDDDYISLNVAEVVRDGFDFGKAKHA